MLQGGSQQQRPLGVLGSGELGGLECGTPAPASGELENYVDMKACPTPQRHHPPPGTGASGVTCAPAVGAGWGSPARVPPWEHGWAPSSGCLPVQLPRALSTESFTESVVAAVRLSPSPWGSSHPGLRTGRSGSGKSGLVGRLRRGLRRLWVGPSILTAALRCHGWPPGYPPEGPVTAVLGPGLRARGVFGGAGPALARHPSVQGVSP